MRVAAIDIGTNSTRLLVADTEGAGSGSLREVERSSLVTGLGRGLDTSGVLAEEAIEDVCAVLRDYLDLASGHGAERTVAVATSAVRDAGNGGAFLAEMRERFALDVRAISGTEEAELSWRGATAELPPSEGRRLVLDIGGGSTELILGRGAELDHHASLQVGVVRHSERYLSTDPADARELEALAGSVRDELESLRAEAGPSPEEGIALAGTPTSLAAMEMGLEPYVGAAVEGYVLDASVVQRRLSGLAAMPLAERVRVPGLHPDRAPTIVTGIVILSAAMRTFGLERIAVSEHDILWGVALAAAEQGS